jgi:hypothetical protein
MTRLTAILGACACFAFFCRAGADPAPATPGVAEPGAESVKEITIDPNVKEPVCRRYTPTGSRIAKQRCESATANSTLGAERDQLRRDIDEMRTRQLMRDQARAIALAEALRRRVN